MLLLLSDFPVKNQHLILFLLVSVIMQFDLGSACHGNSTVTLHFNSEIGLLQVAYKAVMQSVTTTDKAGYESLLSVYRETDVSQERTRVLSKKTFFCSSLCQTMCSGKSLHACTSQKFLFPLWVYSLMFLRVMFTLITYCPLFNAHAVN